MLPSVFCHDRDPAHVSFAGDADFPRADFRIANYFSGKVETSGAVGVRMSLMLTVKARRVKEATHLFVSAPRLRHMKASAEIAEFLYWVVVSAIDLDDAVRSIAKSERRAGRTDESLRRELAVGAGASRRIYVYYRIMTDMALCRAVTVISHI